MESAGLEGRAFLAVDAAGEGTAILVEVNTAEMVDVWRQARAALASTQRWPVLIASWERGGDWFQAFERTHTFSRWLFGEDSGRTDCAPSNVLEQAAQLDLDKRFAGVIGSHDRFVNHRIANTLEWTRGLCGTAPSIEEVRNAVIEDDPLSVELYLLGWEQAHNCKLHTDYQNWFIPDSPVALALLPVAEPWAAYAFVHTLYDCDHALLVKAAQRWNERYGAEPVAL